jgi:hypothetical protein
MNAKHAQEDAKYDATDASQRLKRSALIALDFGFDVKPVDRLVKLLMPERGDPASAGDGCANEAAITDLKAMIEELRPILERLQAFREEHGLSLDTVAVASAIERIESVRSLRKTLDRAASASWEAYAREDEAEARAAILLAKMGTVAGWWFENYEEWPSGAFELVDGDLLPQPHTAVEFVYEVLRAAGGGYSAEEISGHVREMQKSVGMEKCAEDAKEEPGLFEEWMVDFGVEKPSATHLRLVVSN